jgi:hypothetical protein
MSAGLVQSTGLRRKRSWNLSTVSNKCQKEYPAKRGATTAAGITVHSFVIRYQFARYKVSGTGVAERRYDYLPSAISVRRKIDCRASQPWTCGHVYHFPCVLTYIFKFLSQIPGCISRKTARPSAQLSISTKFRWQDPHTYVLELLSTPPRHMTGKQQSADS